MDEAIIIRRLCSIAVHILVAIKIFGVRETVSNNEAVCIETKALCTATNTD